MNKGAQFSDDDKYRFALWRIWDDQKPKLMLIGLNPSKADGETDDPTIRRIRGLSESNGYGGFYMTNLFPFITEYPEKLEYDLESLHKNDFALKLAKVYCEDVCYCWGAFLQAERRATEIKVMFPEALCFGKNKNGSPKHPLYLPKSTTLIKF